MDLLLGQIRALPPGDGMTDGFLDLSLGFSLQLCDYRITPKQNSHALGALSV
jgi:hypothetical protein